MPGKCQICERIRQWLWMLAAGGLAAVIGSRAGLEIKWVLALAVLAGVAASLIHQKFTD